MKYIVAALTIIAASPVAAQSMCEDYEFVEKIIKEQLGQSLVFWGRTTDENMIEVYKDANGKWVVVATGAGLISCIVAAGEIGEMMDPPIPGEEG